MNDDMPSLNGELTPMELKADQLNKIQAQLQQIQGPVRIVVLNMISGILAQTAQIDPALVLHCLCAEMGMGISSRLQGDVAVLMNMRKGFQDAFAEGVRRVPMNQGIMPAGAMPMPPKMRS